MQRRQYPRWNQQAFDAGARPLPRAAGAEGLAAVARRARRLQPRAGAGAAAGAAGARRAHARPRRGRQARLPRVADAQQRRRRLHGHLLLAPDGGDRARRRQPDHPRARRAEEHVAAGRFPRARALLGRRHPVQGPGPAHRARPAGSAAHRRPAPLRGARPGRGFRRVPARPAARAPCRACRSAWTARSTASSPRTTRRRPPPRPPDARRSQGTRTCWIIFKAELLRFRAWALAYCRAAPGGARLPDAHRRPGAAAAIRLPGVRRRVRAVRPAARRLPDGQLPQAERLAQPAAPAGAAAAHRRRH